MPSHQSASPSAIDRSRAAFHEGVYEPERSNAALTSGHRWNEYRSIRKNLL
ncbi:hypothetical protein SAMN04489748_0892 [Bifidobacterium longum]|uniref:Uncharacterized protein n=1 Tax=Bifidobacterium longum TaxID=216816 RepID=A0AA45V6C6_BIFLN|nr:hypothetical protein SAMN04489748_0892 [Bifidobacterium longum]VEG79314.1 Uncharacterised protein [Bifidobacterium longum]